MDMLTVSNAAIFKRLIKCFSTLLVMEPCSKNYGRLVNGLGM